jgi:hypothetical protein
MFSEHLLDAILRSDTATRYAAYFQGRQGGWLSANDIRRMENLDPIDGSRYTSPTARAKAFVRRVSLLGDIQTRYPGYSRQLRERGWPDRGTEADEACASILIQSIAKHEDETEVLQ